MDNRNKCNVIKNRPKLNNSPNKTNSPRNIFIFMVIVYCSSSSMLITFDSIAEDPSFSITFWILTFSTSSAYIVLIVVVVVALRTLALPHHHYQHQANHPATEMQAYPQAKE